MWDHGYDFIALTGNIVTFLGYLVQLRLFIRNIYTTRSSENFDVFPCAVDLFICTIWIFYGILDPKGLLVFTVNLIGAVYVIVQMVFHLIYAARGRRISTFRLLFWVNIVFFCTIFFPTNFSTHGAYRVKVCGWIAATMTLLSFSIPAYRTWTVIHTHDLDPMPLTPLIFFGLSSIIWVVYGAVRKAEVVLIPNVVGIVLAFIQLVVYACFRDSAPHTPFFDLESPPSEPASPNSSGPGQSLEFGRQSEPPELSPTFLDSYSGQSVEFGRGSEPPESSSTFPGFILEIEQGGELPESPPGQSLEFGRRSEPPESSSALPGSISEFERGGELLESSPPESLPSFILEIEQGGELLESSPPESPPGQSLEFGQGSEPPESSSSLRGSISEFERGGELLESSPPESPLGNELEGDYLQGGCLQYFFVILGALVFVWYYLGSL